LGIFGSREETVPVAPENVFVDPDVAARLPDAGAFLLDLISFLDDSSLRAVGAAVDQLRHPNGAIPGERLRAMKIKDWKMGPVTHLALLTAKDSIALEVWASFGLGRRDGQRIGRAAQQVYLTQGIPAAATWAIQSRPSARLDIDFLAEQLMSNWTELSNLIRNGDIIKSFKKWRPIEE
jgi:hypothetical protein